MTDKKTEIFFALHDEAIFQMREVLQLAMLTDTNIVDHMRQLRLTPSAEKPEILVLTPEYKKYHLDIVTKMVEDIEKLQKQVGEEVASTVKGK